VKHVPVRCKCGMAWVKEWSDLCARCTAEEARHQERANPRACVGNETTAERGYDGAWQQARRDCLRRAPWCIACLCRERVLTPATVVDHVTPFRSVPDGEREAYRLGAWNLQPLCASHHDAAKHALECREPWAGVRAVWVRWLTERVLTAEATTLLRSLGLDEGSEGAARSRACQANAQGREMASGRG
jgi:5-methylcytosine-specific restriction endonuclease McrA